LADRAVFKGYALQGIDGKGRVALPAPMRLIVERQGGEPKVTLTDDRKRGCLRAGDLGWSDRLYDRTAADAERALDAGREIDRDEIGSSALGPLDDVPFDASGRFILPPFLKGKGQLTNLAFFWGAGDSIEIWSPDVLLADPSADEGKKERCAWLMNERGAA
jgi:MraZ protein